MLARLPTGSSKLHTWSEAPSRFAHIIFVPKRFAPCKSNNDNYHNDEDDDDIDSRHNSIIMVHKSFYHSISPYDYLEQRQLISGAHTRKR